MGIALFTTSCRNVYYIPNTPNVVLPEKKGDAEITVGVSEGIDLQASYSPVNNIAIMYNANYYELENGSNATEIGRLSEFGLGAYLTSKSSSLRLSVFSGFGKHTYDGRYQTKGDFSDLEADKSFFQVNLGSKGNWFEYALFYRLSKLHYTKVQYGVDGEVSVGDREYLDYLAIIRDIEYSTTGIMIGFGGEQFKFQFNASVKNRTTDMPSFDGTELFPYRIGTVLSYNFNTGKLLKQGKSDLPKQNIWGN